MKNTTTTTAKNFLENEMLHSLPIRVEIDNKPYDGRVSAMIDLLNASKQNCSRFVALHLYH